MMANKGQQRKKVIKNVKPEMELVLSQDESDSERAILEESKNIELIATPSSRLRRTEVRNTLPVTPRRSARKSIKPIQEYDEIITKSCLKANKENEKDEVELEEEPKWTPAKVGRVSQKRGRKSRKVKTTTKMEDTEQITEQLEETFCVEHSKSPQFKSKDSEETLLEQESKINESANKETASMLATSEENTIVLSTNEVLSSFVPLTTSEENSNMLEIKLEAIQIEKSEDFVEINSETQNDENTNTIETINMLPTTSGNSGSFGFHLKSEDMNVSDLGLQPLVDEQVETDNLMESLQISDTESDDENPEIVVPKMVLTDTNGLSNTILPTPTATINVDNDDGDNVIEAAQYVNAKDMTPKQEKRFKPYRFPTPYKSKSTLAFEEIESNECPTLETKMNITTTLTTLEPKEIVIRGIRKRSLSLSVNGKDMKTKLAKIERPINRVTFHSPANQTAVIEEFDLIVKESNKFQVEKKLNVTQRRKRSLSMDETLMGRISKLPRPVHVSTPRKISETPTKAIRKRTKLPNFAAIHQQQFNKMENLVDHVARKVERAKVLTNSAIKNVALKPMTTPTSTKKASNINKTKAAAGLAALQPTVVSKRTPNKILRHTSSENKEAELLDKLPNPRLAIIKPIQKELLAKKVAAKTSTKIAKPVFNLSTLLTTKTVVPPAPVVTKKLLSQSMRPLISTTTIGNVAASSSHETKENKTETRRQRHMEMFKSRTASARNMSEKNSAIIRGVRSNRRFDLQMQHRKNMENN